jgi:hypothetical protein
MTALSVVDPDACPDCGDELAEIGYDQPAVVRHGGYGATIRVRHLACPTCPYQRHHETTETRPAG